MCRICVSEGILTQEEYDRERAAGNPEIFPLNELPPDLAIVQMREVVARALVIPLDMVTPEVAVAMFTLLDGE